MAGGFFAGLGLCGSVGMGFNGASTRGTAVTSGTNTYGSYTQLVAATTADIDFLLVNMTTNATANGGYGSGVRLAVGGSGSEVIFANDLLLNAPSGGYYCITYALPVSIPAGSRISAAGNGQNGTDAVYIHLHGYQTGFMPSGVGLDSMGYLSGIRGSTTIDTNTNGSNAKSPYVEVTSATARDYCALGWSIANAGSSGSFLGEQVAYDIAIGAAASEQIIVRDWLTNSIAFTTTLMPLIPIEIKAGTRISVRAQPAVAGITNASIVLYGVYQ